MGAGASRQASVRRSTFEELGAEITVPAPATGNVTNGMTASHPSSSAPTPGITCRICGNTQNNRPFPAKEMMFGSREEFPYIECGTCGTVQIAEIPPDLGKYYPSDRYFSLAHGASANRGPAHRLIEGLQFRTIVPSSLGHAGAWYRLLSYLDMTEPGVEAVGRIGVRRDARLLEVGCGNGRLLRMLGRLGFAHLRGVDPFLPGDVWESGVSLQKLDVGELDRSAFFDVIILYHSLEHVPDPVATLRSVTAHLARDGVAIVAMPIVNTAFRLYGVHWYQLDPPRHLHLFSVKGFEIALARSGLRLAGSYFNSTAAQFRISEAYARDVALVEIPPARFSFGRARLPEFVTRREARYRSRAHALNASREGDQGVFYLRRSAETLSAG